MPEADEEGSEEEDKECNDKEEASTLTKEESRRLAKDQNLQINCLFKWHTTKYIARNKKHHFMQCLGSIFMEKQEVKGSQQH